MQIGVCHGKEFERNVFSSIKVESPSPLVEEVKDFRFFQEEKEGGRWRKRRKKGGGVGAITKNNSTSHPS